MEHSSTSTGETTTQARAKQTITNLTPRKRRLSEYHDPDYHSNSGQSEATASAKRGKLEVPETDVDEKTSNAEKRLAAIREIVHQEFQKEILMKEQQLNDIENLLIKGRQMLDKLRYDVVREYYRKQEVPLTAADVLKVRGTDSLFSDERSGPQMPLHPAVKRIIGKKPVAEALVTHMPERTAAVVAKETIRLRNPANRRAERRRQQKIREQGIVIDHSKQPKAPIKIELDDEQPCTSKQALERQQLPTNSALNVSRLNNKDKFNFVVGNTSKYIGSELDADIKASSNGQALAYKWLVYVQGKDLAKPLESYLKKVRFQLHHSYRPNDIVDVHTPPFQLTRRGWGEFPMRIQLFFQEYLQQKPVQLIHNVVLDKTMCGLHTMGAETVVEVWLRADGAIASATTSPIKKREQCTPPPSDNSKPRTISITHNKEDLDDNLFDCINKIELSDDIEKIEPTVVVSEPLVCKPLPDSPKKVLPSKSLVRGVTESKNGSRSGIVHLNVNGGVKNEEQTILKPLRQSNGLNLSGNKNVFQKAGKLYIIDPLQSKLKQAQRQQQSLLKPQFKQPLPKHCQLLQIIYRDHCYADMSGLSDSSSSTDTFNRQFRSDCVQLKRPQIHLRQLFNNICFQSMRSAVEFLLRRLPLISEEVGFAFSSRTLADFQAAPAVRQRCFEYLRARTILRWMQKHWKLQQLHATENEHLWSVREVVSFARVHGYTPSMKTAMETPQQQTEQLAQRVQQQLSQEKQQYLLPYSSLTSSANVYDWLAQQAVRRPEFSTHQKDDEQLIDVVDMANENRAEQKRSRFPIINDYPQNCRLLYLPPPPKLEPAAELVRDMCRDVNIHLQPEHNVAGVLQPLALTALAHSLQLFLEKLLRRTMAAKLNRQSQQQGQHSSQQVALPMPAANVELTLMPYDIGRVISQCTEFDFLGNVNLGVSHINSQS